MGKKSHPPVHSPESQEKLDTALRHAIRGSTAASHVLDLMRQGARVRAAIKGTSRLILHELIDHANAEVWGVVLQEKPDLLTPRKPSRNPAVGACGAGKAWLAQMAWDATPRPWREKHELASRMLVAASLNYRVALMRLALNLGGDPNAMLPDYGETPLHIICKSHRTDASEPAMMLLAAGADPYLPSQTFMKLNAFELANLARQSSPRLIEALHAWQAAEKAKNAIAEISADNPLGVRSL